MDRSRPIFTIWKIFLVLNHHHHTVELKLGRGNGTKVRDIIFANDDDAMTSAIFSRQSLGKLEAGQAQRRLDDYLSKGKDLGSKVLLLVEVVSAASPLTSCGYCQH